MLHNFIKNGPGHNFIKNGPGKTKAPTLKIAIRTTEKAKSTMKEPNRNGYENRRTDHTEINRYGSIEATPHTMTEQISMQNVAKYNKIFEKKDILYRSKPKHQYAK